MWTTNRGRPDSQDRHFVREDTIAQSSLSWIGQFRCCSVSVFAWQSTSFQTSLLSASECPCDKTPEMAWFEASVSRIVGGFDQIELGLELAGMLACDCEIVI